MTAQPATFIIATLVAHARLLKITALLILLTGVVLVALSLIHGDEALAAMACRSPRGC